MTILNELPKPPRNPPTERDLTASWRGNFDEPLVTIKCITYNHEPFIRDALNGFLMQKTDFPFRIVVHDDASNDSTQEIIKHYAGRYPNVIKTILQEKNLHSRGIKRGPYVDPLVAGQYIALCEGDDYWIDANKLQRQVNVLAANPNYSASAENSLIHFLSTNDIGAFSKLPDHLVSIPEMLRGRVFSTASVVHRASGIAGRDEALRVAGDIGTWCYLATQGEIHYRSVFSSVYRRGAHGAVLGTDPLNWARKIERWNDDLEAFLAEPQLTWLFKRRNFANYHIAGCNSALSVAARLTAWKKCIQYDRTGALRSLAGRLPIAGPMAKKARSYLEREREESRLWARHEAWMRKTDRRIQSNLVIGVTSLPARIEKAWMAIVSLLDQEIGAEKVVLVLAEEEFPSRALPSEYRLLETVGLEILWVSRNSGGYKKLLPILERYPGCDVITADDGVVYSNSMVSELLEARNLGSRTIVGHGGWQMRALEGRLLPSRLWPYAAGGTASPSVLLPGREGIFYPREFLRSGELKNLDRALELCPTADDIWFWAVSVLEGWVPYCIGNHAIDTIHPQRGAPELGQLNLDADDVQVANAIGHFDIAIAQTL